MKSIHFTLPSLIVIALLSVTGDHRPMNYFSSQHFSGYVKLGNLYELIGAPVEKRYGDAFVLEQKMRRRGTEELITQDLLVYYSDTRTLGIDGVLVGDPITIKP